MLSVSRLHSVDDRIIHESVAVGEKKLIRETEVIVKTRSSATLSTRNLR
jgi:hypothetical protein